ncbi:hypothetical protein BJX99DRAFT_215804 [Aspergillus californicus]
MTSQSSLGSYHQPTAALSPPGVAGYLLDVIFVKPIFDPTLLSSFNTHILCRYDRWWINDTTTDRQCKPRWCESLVLADYYPSRRSPLVSSCLPRSKKSFGVPPAALRHVSHLMRCVRLV